MQILPTNTLSNNRSFQAVNQKYYNKAIKELGWSETVTGNLIYCLTADVLTFKTISPQDGVDTVKAIKALYKNKKHPFINWLNEILGIFKQEAKKERIAERRALKKGGK